MKKKLIILILAFNLLLIAGVMIYVYNFSEEEIENAGKPQIITDQSKKITYNGQTEELRSRLRTVLIIGIDGEETLPEYGADDLIPFINRQQADFITLVVIDDANKKVDLIQINRDTMTDVPYLGVTGEFGGHVYEQIALSHNFGSGLDDSCRNTCRAVSEFLFNAPVDHYINLSMAAIPILNDAIGGVTVKVEDDMTAVDPELIQGSTVKLKGDQAIKFVRMRKDVADQTNISRMRRQRTFINGYISQAKSALNEDANVIYKSILKVGKYMLTDMSTDSLTHLFDSICNYELHETYSPVGKSVEGEKYMEFYPDLDQMWEKLKDMLC